MNKPSPKFSRIFVVELSRHDLTPLQPYADEIIFLSSGHSEPADALPKMLEKLKTFDPEVDAIVPTGRLAANLLAGTLLSKFPKITIGLFRGKDVKDYSFTEVILNGQI